jgi:quinol monooxygenase YgiN
MFISRHKVKEGKLEQLREHSRQVTPTIKAEKPGTVAFLAYLNEEGTEVTFFHLFPDAAALDDHLEGAGERSQAAYEYLEPMSMHVLGRPSAAARQVFEKAAESGVDVHFDPELMGGYIRLESG